MGIVNLKSQERFRKLVAVIDKSEFLILKKIYKIDNVLAKFIPNDSLTWKKEWWRENKHCEGKQKFKWYESVLQISMQSLKFP